MFIVYILCGKYSSKMNITDSLQAKILLSGWKERYVNNKLSHSIINTIIEGHPFLDIVYLLECGSLSTMWGRMQSLKNDDT